MPTTNDFRPTNVRVLVIEPANALRQTLHEALWPHWVTRVAASATTGLGIAAWYRPTIVIVEMFDAGMEASSFATLVKYGRAEEVMLIGTTTADHEASARATAGVDAVFVKPFEAESLVKAIEQHLGKTSHG